MLLVPELLLDAFLLNEDSFLVVLNGLSKYLLSLVLVSQDQHFLGCQILLNSYSKHQPGFVG